MGAIDVERVYHFGLVSWLIIDASHFPLLTINKAQMVAV